MHQDIEDFGEKERKVFRRYFSGNGGETEQETQKTCAKMNTVHENGSARNFCHVKFFRGKMFDPQGIDSTKIRLAEYRKVDEDTFNLYLDYLKSKNGESLIRAERRYIHV